MTTTDTATTERIYPTRVLADLADAHREHPGHYPQPDTVAHLGPRVILDYWLQWVGIIGYTDLILGIVRAEEAPL